MADDPQFRHTRVPNFIFDAALYPEMTAPLIATYAAVRSWCYSKGGGFGRCWASYQNIGRRSRQSSASVKRNVKALEKLGLVYRGKWHAKTREIIPIDYPERFKAAVEQKDREAAIAEAEEQLVTAPRRQRPGSRRELTTPLKYPRIDWRPGEFRPGSSVTHIPEQDRGHLEQDRGQVQSGPGSPVIGTEVTGDPQTTMLKNEVKNEVKNEDRIAPLSNSNGHSNGNGHSNSLSEGKGVDHSITESLRDLRRKRMPYIKRDLTAEEEAQRLQRLKAMCETERFRGGGASACRAPDDPGAGDKPS